MEHDKIPLSYQSVFCISFDAAPTFPEVLFSFQPFTPNIVSSLSATPPIIGRERFMSMSVCGSTCVLLHVDFPDLKNALFLPLFDVINALVT